MSIEVSYKPGWSVEWTERPHPDEPDARIVRVTVKVRSALNTDGSGERLDLASSHESKVRTEEGVKLAIHFAIQYVELHEMNEWLRFNGVQYINPHPLLE